MQIANLKKSDIYNFSRLAKQVILESPYYSDFAKKECLKDFHPKEIKKDINNENILLITAKNDTKIIGFIRGFFDGGLASGIFWLQWIGINSAYRKKNIANEMLDYLAKKLKSSFKTHKIVCVIRPKNRTSIALFKKNKYQKLTYLKKHWYGEDFLLWYKCI